MFLHTVVCIFVVLSWYNSALLGSITVSSILKAIYSGPRAPGCRWRNSDLSRGTHPFIILCIRKKAITNHFECLFIQYSIIMVQFVYIG